MFQNRNFLLAFLLLCASFGMAQDVVTYQMVTDASQVTAGNYVIGVLRSTTASNNFYFATSTIAISGNYQDLNTTDSSLSIPETDGVRCVSVANLPAGTAIYSFSGDAANGFSIKTGELFFYPSSIENRKLTLSPEGTNHRWNVIAKSGPINGGLRLRHIAPNGGYNYDVQDFSTSTSTVNSIRGYVDSNTGKALYLFKEVTTGQPSTPDVDPTPGENPGGDNTPTTAYTITFDAGIGDAQEASLTETAPGLGITLPGASIANLDGTTFYGWAESPITETTSAPVVFSYGTLYNPSADVTLYAVYRTGGYLLQESNNSLYVTESFGADQISSAVPIYWENGQLYTFRDKGIFYCMPKDDSFPTKNYQFNSSFLWQIVEAENTISFEYNTKYLGLDNDNSRMYLSAHQFTKLIPAGTSVTYSSAPVRFTQQSVAINGIAGNAYYATFSNAQDVFMVADEVFTITVEQNLMRLHALSQETANSHQGYFIPKNTGVLIKHTASSATYYTVDNVNLQPLSSNLLLPCPETGIFKAEPDQNTYYKLAYDDYDAKTGLGFYWGNEEGSGNFRVKSGGAVLAVPQTQAATRFLLPIANTPTDIELEQRYAENGKIIQNGQMLIIRNGQMYNALGQLIR